jgi:putative ABC transport system substrate-binding protein
MRRREFITLVGGAVTALPSIVRAQQVRKIPTVAYLWHAGNADEESPYYGAVREGFAKLGYSDGANIKLIHRFPNEKPEAFRSMAAELVSMNPDVLMGGGISSAYLKAATATIPIGAVPCRVSHKRKSAIHANVRRGDGLGCDTTRTGTSDFRRT